MAIFFRLFEVAFVFYSLGLLIYALLGWFGGNVETNVWRAKMAPAYEPLLRPLRGVIKPIKVDNRAIDLTPLVLLVALWLVVSSIVYIFAGRTL